MKNEIGRKLTSLTIMAIMFAGGMTIAAPGLMPEAVADLSVTDGALSVSTETLQGAAILEIVVNDPDYSATDTDIPDGPTVDIMNVEYDMVQSVNGKWYLYVVDDSASTTMDADDNGLEFGADCSNAGLGVKANLGAGTSGSADIIGATTDVWAEVTDTNTTAALDERAGGCLDANGAGGVAGQAGDTATTTERSLFSTAVLQNAPSLSNHDDLAVDNASADLGQRGHSLNATSGYGSWPYILQVEFSSDASIDYGSDSITIEYGNTDDYTDIGLNNINVADDTEIHLWIQDPGLNIDPTTADEWEFDLNQSTSFKFANNGTNLAIGATSAAEVGQFGCVDNCLLTVDDASTAPGQLVGYDDVLMVETGPNTGIFESFDSDGVSELRSKVAATADSQHTFKYGGDSADLIIAYNDASISMTAPSAGDWKPATQATITITDPDLNKNPLDAETLEIGNSSSVIPTIKIGSPMTLATGANSDLGAGDAGATTGVTVGHDKGSEKYTLNVQNTTDNSERLRIIHNAADAGLGQPGHTHTWINVTTGYTRAQLVDLPGTVVLNYDISGPAGILGSTGVSVYLTDSGINGTNTTTSNTNANLGEIALATTGNAQAGVLDLDDGVENVGKNTSVTASAQFGNPTLAGTTKIHVAFKIDHEAGDKLLATEDYAIAADFCNFDQNNGSLVHNCIYRLEAEETGDNTGVFTGKVEYITLNNSTSQGAVSGEHDGNDFEVEGLLTGMNGDELIVVLMDSVSGADAVRVAYNDTDAMGSSGGTKVGAQLDTVTHTGTADLDSGDYEADDMATITIVDPDLNQDSTVRDVYQNSSTTFNVTVTQSGKSGTEQLVGGTMTIIETTVDSGVFVGTFIVPDYKGSDMELTYYESRDAGGNAVQFFDTATVSSNMGSVSFDRSVYPVPFASADLRTGADGETGQSESGNVTAWITVTDTDVTTDTLTTGSTTAAGTILVKLIQTAQTDTCFTAGSIAAQTNTDTSTAQELGPLTEIVRDSQNFEVAVVFDEVQHCGANMRTIVSGDIIQVEYVDTADNDGTTSTAYDSSTFDLRTGSLSVDKDVYVLGSDMVVTLTDPDLNLDSTSTETYAMSILEWDSDAASSALLSTSDFSNNPSVITETGDDTGVFQTVVTLPESTVGGTAIDYGEAVTLTYVDVGLSGENTTEDDVLDVEAYFSISNFGALIELDKAVYNWTDLVTFSITSPDHNVNTAAEENIGTKALPIQVTTRSGKLCDTGDKTYKAAETGVDTGVFEGEVQLANFAHTMSSDSGDTAAGTTSCGSSSTSGTLITASQTDGVSVSYEYNDATVVVASASITWNIGEASFDSSAVSAGGSAVMTVVDADENMNTAIVDSFTVDVFSDSDNGGFKLTMTETNEDTGVFEGTVYFTSDQATSGSNLRVSEGDTVTAEYVDETLPEPYTTSDDLTIAATTTVGTAFPPLERAPAANARVVDAFGSSVAEVSVDQQVQIAATVKNGQSGDQAFAYLVQVQDGNGVTVSLAWITGSLTAGQSMSPALSWTPSASGSYTATVFVWESVDNPTALSPTVSVNIDVV